MKKIAVYSFFDSHNIGDILIAAQVKKIFSTPLNCSFFDIGSGKRDVECNLKDYICAEKTTVKQFILKVPFIGDLIHTFLSAKSNSYKSVYTACLDYDIVIFAGGNQIMELNRFPTSIIGFYRTIKVLKSQGKKICFCFCGIGPFKSLFGKIIAKKIFSMADFISVRDGYSLSWIKRLLPEKETQVWCDPVLLLAPENDAKNHNNAIGINVYFGYESKYKKKMMYSYVRVIDELRKKFKDIDIYLFSSELTDIKDINAVKNYFFNDNKIIIKNIKSAEELFDFYCQVDLVVAARMHSAITATVSEVPVLSIAWQQKVSAFMELMNNSSLNFEIDTFIKQPDFIVKKIIESLSDRESLLRKNRSSLSNLRKTTLEKAKAFIKSLEV